MKKVIAVAYESVPEFKKGLLILFFYESGHKESVFTVWSALRRYYTKPFHLIADKRENFLLSEIEFDSNFYSAELNSCRLRYFQ